MKTTEYSFSETAAEGPYDIEPKEGVVYFSRYDKWAILICPCGCGDKLMLSLMEGVKPCWKVDKESRTITPSIHKIEGCKSHFHITNGKVC